ncbi:MAG: B12-binding domain-containing radical SAM protein [Magnetococcales bacterium]|nr:B12-binding domain-containing radical SAM protein [Magnetococcales bacterium]
MKILLLATPFNDAWINPLLPANTGYPMGLPYIHAVLEQHGHTVTTLPLNHIAPADADRIIQQTLEDFQPEVVGFNILSDSRVSALAWIKRIHHDHPRIQIIAGGVHATTMREQIVRHFPRVVIVVGEGELTTPELITALQHQTPLDAVAGIAFWNGQQYVETPSRPLLDNLDQLPFPKHELFFTPSGFQAPGRTWAFMLTSRGCPYHCSFCVLSKMTNRQVRFRSVAHVIAEIVALKTRYPELQYVWFNDDQFFLKNSRVIEFCTEIIRLNLGLKFLCSARFRPISAEMLTAMEKAGFEQLYFGLESGSQKILDLAQKALKQKDVLHAVELLKHSRMKIGMFLIVGLQGESAETIQESINFIQTLQKIRYVEFGDSAILMIYPATHVYDLAREAGQISDEYWLGEGPTPYFTVEHSVAELQHLRNTLLDGVALNRFFTWNGFRQQVFMLPYIIRTAYRCGYNPTPTLAGLVRLHFPRLYTGLRGLYRLAKKWYRIVRPGFPEKRLTHERPGW